MRLIKSKLGGLFNYAWMGLSYMLNPLLASFLVKDSALISDFSSSSMLYSCVELASITGTGSSKLKSASSYRSLLISLVASFDILDLIEGNLFN